jgi:hypothetical protein
MQYMHAGPQTTSFKILQVPSTAFQGQDSLWTFLCTAKSVLELFLFFARTSGSHIISPKRGCVRPAKAASDISPTLRLPLVLYLVVGRRTGVPRTQRVCPWCPFAGGGGRASPRIHVAGVRAHPPSVQTFVHLTNRHYGAVSVAGRPTFCCAVHC